MTNYKDLFSRYEKLDLYNKFKSLYISDLDCIHHNTGLTVPKEIKDLYVNLGVGFTSREMTAFYHGIMEPIEACQEYLEDQKRQPVDKLLYENCFPLIDLGGGLFYMWSYEGESLKIYANHRSREPIESNVKTFLENILRDPFYYDGLLAHINRDAM